jgi:predicted 3-demethylubiquinone-9 3-methyltransferase (glyoxalase superfamily)
MKNKIFTCLWFDGKAKAAADFYCTVFSNTAITSSNPMVTTFEIEGRKFMGLNGGPMFTINPSVSFFVNCSTLEEIDTLWNKLSKGGSVMMPLNTYPWSEKYGWCQDQFGVNWQLMMGKMEDSKIVPAMMFTQEQAGKAATAINYYTSLFPDSKTILISKYEKGEPDVEGYIKHAQFYLSGQLFAAMDSSAAHAFKFDEGVSFVVNCENQEEIDMYWNALTADGGKESMCGWLVDKFGFSWQIVPDVLGNLMNSAEKAGKVMPVLMQMKKLDIAALTKAAES